MMICQCGTQAGYPHEKTCPFPYYGTDEKRIVEWGQARIYRFGIPYQGIDARIAYRKWEGFIYGFLVGEHPFFYGLVCPAECADRFGIKEEK